MRSSFVERNAAAKALREVRGLRRAREDRDRAATLAKDRQQQQAASRESALDRGFEAKQAKLGRLADLKLQKRQGGSQLKLAKFGAEKEKELQELKGRQASLARLGAPRKGGLTTKNRFDIRKGLNEEFYGDNPAGEALRKHYGENGFGLFATQMEQRYQPQQPGLPTPPQPPVQTRPFQNPATGVWQGGQMKQPSMLPSAGSPGQLPARQQVEQPTGMMSATLPPSPQPLSSFGVSIPEEFTEADRPEFSRVLPQRTQNIISGAKQLGRVFSAPVDPWKKRKRTQREQRLSKSFTRPRPY